jgi:hypothetical protein
MCLRWVGPLCLLWASSRFNSDKQVTWLTFKRFADAVKRVDVKAHRVAFVQLPD